MRIHVGAACAMITILAGALGCGYTAPNNNPPRSSDSTRDSTSPPPSYSR